jgi:hypothetical protein
LLSPGDDAYLEVIAPDPDQDVPGGWAQPPRRLEAPAEPGLTATIGVGITTVALESTAETMSWSL